MERVVLRAYSLPDDLDGLVRVYMDSVAHHAALDPDPPRSPITEAHARVRFERMTADPDSLCLVAEAERAVAGLLEAHLRREDITGFVGVYVNELAVARQQRGRGIGRRLMAAAEEWARRHGASSIALDAMLANTGALRLYEEHLGFTRVAVILRRNLRHSDPGA